MLSRSSVHAVRAMVSLAALPDGEYGGTTAIALAAGVPRNYLAKLLHAMSRRGLVLSQRGLGGGFRLARDPALITLFDIVEAVEDIARWRVCAFGEKTCSDDHPCALHHRWGRVRDAYFSMLKNTSVADLANKASGAHPQVAVALGAMNPRRPQ